MKDEQQSETIGRIKRNNTATPPPLPIIGNIRIGEKVKRAGSDKEYPVSLDYFKATGDYAKLFLDAYGKEPKRIQVVFISNDNVHSCLEEYDARDAQGRRAGYGNGEDVYLYDGSKGVEDYKKYNAVTDKAFIKQYTQEKKLVWQVVLTLHFVIPKIKGVFGVWRFQTRGAKSSIIHLINSFDTVKNSAGTIINIPFDFTVEKVKSQKPDSTRVFPVCQLIPNISQENLQVLGEYIQHGRDIARVGLLTEEKLLQLKTGGGVALNQSNDSQTK